MALILGGGRRRWVCRAACRGGKGRAVAGCRHFHVHYHFPRQVCAFSSLRLLPSFSLWPYLLIPPVLFFAVLAFLVLFGWFTLVYFVSSLLCKENDHQCFNGVTVDRAGNSDELCRADEQGGKREDKLVAESACGYAMAEVCAERHGIKEVFVDEFFDDSRGISRIASPDACTNDEENSSDEKLVEEVVIFETNWKELKVISGLDASSEEQELQGTSTDWFVEKHDSREFSASSNAAKSLDVQYGVEFVANRNEVSAYASSEIVQLIDKHETRAVVVTAPDDSACVKSVAELPDTILANKPPEDIFDEQQVTEKMVTHYYKKKVPENDVEDNGKQIVGISEGIHDLNNKSETSWLPHDSVENKYATGASSNASFHPTDSIEDAEHEEELTENKKLEASGTTSLDCDCPENYWAIREEAGSFANEDKIHEVSSRESSVTERTQDEDESSDDNCTSKGASLRLPLVRRSPPPWWNLCGVLDVFAGCED